MGPTTVHAFMQAMGPINDHVEDCVISAEVERARGLPATGTPPLDLRLTTRGRLGRDAAA